MSLWTRCSKNRGIQTITANSLTELIALAGWLSHKEAWGCRSGAWGGERFFSNGIWFRGQRHLVVPQPSIYYREPPGFPKGQYDEVTLFTEFRARLGCRTGMPSETEAIPWMAFMRHYDLPNRVLDWSKSLLVALHFALHGDSREPHLWVLNARALNEVTHHPVYLNDMMTEASEPKKPYIWYPDSFPAVLRAEQVRGRRPDQWIQVLRHTHPAARGYPGDGSILKRVEKLLEDNHPLDRDAFLDLIYSQDEETRGVLWRLATPAAVHPPWNNPRILAQKGVLTVHGGGLMKGPGPADRYISPPAMDFELIVNRCARTGMILRRINLENIENFRRDVRALGSEYSDLMPETENQVRAILDAQGGEQEL